MRAQSGLSGPVEPRLAPAPRLAASIEISPRQAIDSPALPTLFPPATRVYLTDLGNDDAATLIAAATRLRRCGYEPVPHFAARRIVDADILEERLRGVAGEAGVQDVLVIGGGLDRPAGPFAGALDLLATGAFDRHGITRIGLAGHPEGSPDFSEVVALDALRLKQDFCERTGAQPRIVTQFGFDGEAFGRWANALSQAGIAMPIHMGVAGPAKLTALVKYAALCGIGNSIGFLKKRMGSLLGLVANFSPDDIVLPIETAAAEPASPIVQLHVFPFGGLPASAQWLKERGSWNG